MGDLLQNEQSLFLEITTIDLSRILLGTASLSMSLRVMPKNRLFAKKYGSSVLTLYGLD